MKQLFESLNKMSEYIKVDLVHNLYKNKVWKEIKLNKFDTIENIKNKIYIHTGTPVSDMKLYAYDYSNVEQTQVFLGDNHRCLNDYNVQDTYIIYIHANEGNPSNSIYNIDDEEILKNMKDFKYQISEDAYNKRQNSMRNFLKQLRKKKAEETVMTQSSTEANSITENATKIYDQEMYKIGNRCRVKMGDRRGILKFIGNLKNKTEIFVGVDLDEPLGNSDGTYQKQFLFECKGDKYGYLGNINSIEIGDFPPIDFMNLEEF